MTNHRTSAQDRFLTDLRMATGPGFNHVGPSNRVIWAAGQTQRPTTHRH